MTIELEQHSQVALAQTVRIRQHTLLADVGAQEGGADQGPTPHDLYDAALAACKAITVAWYARKKGIPVDDIQTLLTRDDGQERSGVYKLTATLRIRGALTGAQLAELGNVAQKCPVHKLMTAVTTEIATNVERQSS